MQRMHSYIHLIICIQFLSLVLGNINEKGVWTKMAYLEDGEVFEQQDQFDNSSNEAIIKVPAHSNLHGLTVVLQPSTVSSQFFTRIYFIRST